MHRKNENPDENEKRSKPRHGRRLRKLAFVLILVAVALGTVRLALPYALRGYVNRTLERSPLYTGKIARIQIHLWRGAYSIHDLRISKTTGNIPVPLFAAKRVDFALQWSALFHGKAVGRILLDQPELNFVDAPEEGESQTGAGSPWLQIIRDLFPFRINSTFVHDGSIHFRAYQTPKPLDVYLSHVEGTIDDLGNIREATDPLVATVRVKAEVMDQARLELRMTLDPFSYRPTFHLALRLLGLDVTRINDLALAYGRFDFKRGWLDLVVEADSKEGLVTGYVKPLFRNLQVFNLAEDVQNENVLQVFWQALVGATTSLLKNRPRDQFGTLIPFSADASGSTTLDLLATIGNVLRNAFVRTYLPRIEHGSDLNTPGRLQFSAPDFDQSISTADEAR